MTANQPRPNLFTYATSELSQDAFICWLAEWADPKYKTEDEALHRIGQEFIISMVRKAKINFESNDIESVDIVPQFQKLDILIKLNADTPNKLAILVEDKTHTSNHSGQLERYHKLVKEAGYQEDQMIPLYFKTGYQSKFDTIGIYKTYLRNDFLAVLQNGKQQGINNAIYDDFLAHLTKIDVLIKEFSTKHIDKWLYHDWIGFFTVLYDQRSPLSNSSEDDGANWGYVANPSGGFVGYWWYFRQLASLENMRHVYLQLEEECLCFKIEVDVEDKNIRAKLRDNATEQIITISSVIEPSIKRSKPVGNGKFMTISVWENYRVANEDGLLDFDATLTNLKKAQSILDAAFPAI